MGTFSVTMSGNFLPIQLIYQGTTDRCTGFSCAHPSNHWANEETSIDLLKKIIIPYVETTRKELGLDKDFPWVLICDVFKGKWTDLVKSCVVQSRGKMSAVPNNWTNYFQPLDISVNKPCKDFLRNKAQTWFSSQIAEKIKEGKLYTTDCGQTPACKVGNKVLRLYHFKTRHRPQWMGKIKDY